VLGGVECVCTPPAQQHGTAHINDADDGMAHHPNCPHTIHPVGRGGGCARRPQGGGSPSVACMMPRWPIVPVSIVRTWVLHPERLPLDPERHLQVGLGRLELSQFLLHRGERVQRPRQPWVGGSQVGATDGGLRTQNTHARVSLPRRLTVLFVAQPLSASSSAAAAATTQQKHKSCWHAPRACTASAPRAAPPAAVAQGPPNSICSRWHGCQSARRVVKAAIRPRTVEVQRS
jgi:hypothetical protein